MIPVILDLQTGAIASARDLDMSPSWWSEGSGGCDCNRAIALDVDFPDGVCAGARRFVIVDAYGDFDGMPRDVCITDANLDYEQRVVDRAMSEFRSRN